MNTAPDQDFAASVAARLAGLPGVRAVALGGSRVTGGARPDSAVLGRLRQNG